jgi:histidine triad (HIT) family protein
MADQCLFCRIVRGEIPASMVLETDECIAIRDINPQAPVHVVVIPKEHVASLEAVKDAALVGRLALVAAEVARREGIAESGYRTVINTNADGGQTVFHLHQHVLGGRHMKWPPG